MFYFPKDWINLENQIQVLIVGSGAAGLSLALKLEKLHIPSVIVEGGELDFTEDSQEIYKGESIAKYIQYKTFYSNKTKINKIINNKFDQGSFLPHMPVLFPHAAIRSNS